MKRKGVSIAIAITMVLATLGGVTWNKKYVYASTNISNPRVAEDGTVTWDKVEFGSYYQDAEFTPEPIKWRILDIDDNGNALLLADKLLDCKPYNSKGVEYQAEDGSTSVDYSCTWETCTLRQWLNGTGDYEDDNTAFIKVAFTDEERSVIKKTDVVNDNNPSYNTEGGSDTQDKVFLLSLEEVCNSDYGFKPTEDSAYVNNTKKAQNTYYAFMTGGTRWRADISWGSWWLRSPGFSTSDVVCVDDYGLDKDIGNNVDNDTYAVRPALCVNLSSTCIMDAGKVLSDGREVNSLNRTSKDYNKPNNTDGITTWDCVFFGKYKQDVKFESKPIEWRVLSVSADGTDALLLADKAIDSKPYNIKGEKKQSDTGLEYTDYSCTWETSTIRDWLNGTGDYTNDESSFINSAFTDEEYRAIKETCVINSNNKKYNTDGGNNTLDRVFLLSIDEVSNSSYGFDVAFEEESVTRQAEPTGYARRKGAGIVVGRVYTNTFWWLRSPGGENELASVVGFSGCGTYDDEVDGYAEVGYVDDTHIAIRPALHVDISVANLKVSDTVQAKSGLKPKKPPVNDDNTNEDGKKESEIVATTAQNQTVEISKVTIEVGKTIKTKDANYTVIKKDTGKSEVSYQAPENTKSTSYVVPDTVTLTDGTVASVTEVAPNAFKKCKKLKKVVLGKNIEKIDKNAFSGCKNLKSITIKSTKLTKKSFGKNAFKGISKKATITVPKKQYKNYKKWLKAAGLPKGVKIKKK